VRAVLGVPRDPAIDVWAVGCMLYELCTGKILSLGRSDNQMYKHILGDNPGGARLEADTRPQHAPAPARVGEAA
jgi:serine/threonine protein kinase